MRRELALTGAAALTAGLLLGFVVDRVARIGAAAAFNARPQPARRSAADLRVARRRRRIRRVFLVALRRSFPHLGRFTPSLSARLAEEIFRTPPKHARLRR